MIDRLLLLAVLALGFVVPTMAGETVTVSAAISRKPALEAIRAEY